MIKDCKNFLNKIKELKPYLVEFNKNNIIKDKIYPPDWAVRGKDCQLIIIITHNICIFLANDGIYKV